MSHFTDLVKAGLCGRCGKRPPATGKSVCSKCRNETVAINKSRRASYRKKGMCVDCGKKSGNFQSCKTCRKRRKDALTRHRTSLKEQVFEAYGGMRCACKGCPENKNPHIEFLTINHMQGGGTKHRARLGGKRIAGGGVTHGGHLTYAWLRRNNFPPGYNVLCWNCQWGVHINKGNCPHNRKG